MFIFKDIKELPIKYYGKNDWGGIRFVNHAIDNLCIIKQSIDEINSPIKSQGELYQYLWAKSFKEMIKEVNEYDLNDVEKSELVEIADKLDVSLGKVVKYINNNYEIVFSKEKNADVMWHDYFEFLVEICYKKCSNSIEDIVFDFIESKFYLNLLTMFEYCDKFYKNNRERFKSLFKELKKSKLYDDKIYIRFLMNQVDIDDDFLKEQAIFICERVINDFENNVIFDDNVDIIQLVSSFEDYCILAYKFKLSCANRYTIVRRKLLLASSTFILKHGQKKSLGPTDFSPLIDGFKNDNNGLKFLRFTHNYCDGNYSCIFDDILNDSDKNRPFDFAGQPGKASSEKYPYSKQEEMDACIEIYKWFINYFVVDEKLKQDFGLFILSISKELEKRYFNGSINISNEIAGEYEMILNVISLGKENKTKYPIFKALTNGCVMNMCGTIEKIIRNVVIKEDKGLTYFNPDKSSLGNLLSKDINSMSPGLVYYLNYYLCSEHIDNKTSIERPGKNIRNIQMHNYDYKYDETDERDCFALLFLIVCIINDLTLKNMK